MKSTINRSFGYVISIFILIALGLGACKKLVEVPGPVTSTNSANVYTNDATSAAVLTSIYTNISQSNFDGGITSLSLLTGLSGDELTLFNGSSNTQFIAYYRNALTNSNTQFLDFWQKVYPVIFVANSAVEGLNNSTSLTPAVKQQLTGEAKFIRAFCYFYLCNLYGDVPLALTTDYNVNARLSRSPKAQIYQQIIADLKDAQNLLSNNYLKSDAFSAYPIGSAERVRPTKWAATALLARVYLYYGNLSGDPSNYTNAEIQTTAVINNSSFFSLTALNNVFLKNSNEAIWQLQPVQSGYNTYDAQLFIIPSTGPSNINPVYLSSNLLNNFEAGDNRKVYGNWIDTVTAGGITYYYPYKYKAALNSNVTSTSAMTEYLMVLRLGEQYLIRAEARAQLGESNALNDLNTIRNRAGLGNYAGATDKTSLLAAIMHERQVELFTECGHRWLDLKRTNSVDAVMSVVTPQKGGTWNTNLQWYPITLTELQTDPNLKQEAGY